MNFSESINLLEKSTEKGLKMSFFANESLTKAPLCFGHEKLNEFPEYVNAVVKIRKASALANRELGYLSKEKAAEISRVCDGLINVSEPLTCFEQTILRFVGMPANKIINEQIQIKAEIPISLDEISLNQWTNDVTVTAEAIAIRSDLSLLSKNLRILCNELGRKAKEFEGVVKCGRLGLRDSFPIRLGDEFKSHKTIIEAIIGELQEEEKFWTFSVLGAGDLGTGLGVLPSFSSKVTQLLSEELGYKLSLKEEEFQPLLNNRYRFIIAHSKIQAAAVALWKLARDLTIMASGPRAGIREIVLPAVAPGSSIMPGKINPTVAELIMNICDKVFANSSGLNVGVHAGWLENDSNSSLPLKAILDSCQLLSRGAMVLVEKVVKGITSNSERCLEQAQMSLAPALFLQKIIGKNETKKVLEFALINNISLADSYRKLIGEIEKGSLLEDLFDVYLLSRKEGAKNFMNKLRLFTQ